MTGGRGRGRDGVEAGGRGEVVGGWGRGFSGVSEQAKGLF